MRLREFDLDAPHSAARQEFREQTRCVTSLFERVFGQLEIDGDYWKILVEAVDRATQAKAKNLLGVLVVEASFDFHGYSEAPGHQKKRMAFELLCSGIAKVIEGGPQRPSVAGSPGGSAPGYECRVVARGPESIK